MRAMAGWLGLGRMGSRRRVLVCGVLACGVVLCLPACALAGFTRPFVDEVTESEVGRPLDPTGVTVDGQDRLWVADGSPELAVFSPAYEVTPHETPNHFLEFVALAGSAGEEGVAAERSMPAGNDELYVTHNLGKNNSEGSVEAFEEHGEPKESWEGIFRAPHVVVDNSTDPLDPSACGTMPPLSPEECIVYVAAEVGLDRVLEKFNSKHVPEDFSALGTNKLTLGEADRVGASVAVDAVGDIYAFGEKAVGVFAPSGQALAESFSIENPEVERVGEGEVGEIEGTAIDPVSGHLLVAVSAAVGRVGAVDEFDIKSGRFVGQLAQTREGHLHRPVGLAVDSRGDVYVLDEEEDVVDVWGPGAYHPTVVLGAAGGRVAGGAVLNGTVDPEQEGNPTPAPVTGCFFEVVEEARYLLALGKHEEEGFAGSEHAGCEEPDAGEIHLTSPEVAHAVHARISNLVAGRTYRYRLVAETDTADNGGVGVSEEARAFTEPARPSVLSSSVSGVSLSFAELHAMINPLGADTSYYFQYGPTTAYGQDAPALPGASIGAGGPTGSMVESVLQPIGGLAPGSEYHFRVVASNEAGTEYGPDGTFMTEPEVQRGPPDNRSYELVTPADKEGGSDMFAEPETNGEFLNANDLGTPAFDGEAFLLTTFSAFGEFPFAEGEAYVFHREPTKGRWSYVSLAASTLGVQDYEEGSAFDLQDFSRVAFDDGIGSKESTEGEHLSDLAGPPGALGLCQGAVGLAGAQSNGCYVELAQDAKVAGASQNLEHIILEAENTGVCSVALLCEWAGGYQTLPDGEVVPQLKPVDVNEEGEVISCGASLGAGLFNTGGGSAYHAVSPTGSTVLFTADTGSECKGTPQLYARIDGTRTLQLSEPEAGVIEAGQPGGHPKQYPAEYVGASEDDTRVFFATETWLTENHPAGHDLELYEWRSQHTEGAGGPCPNPEGCLTRITTPVNPAGEPTPTAGGALHIVLAVAAEGTAIYYTANNILATNETNGAHAEPGTCEKGSSNGACALYRYQPATTITPAQTTYIATLPSSTFGHTGFAANFIIPSPRETPAYATPDGRYLLYQNGGENDIGGPLYRYDSQTGSLVAIAGGSFIRSASREPSSGPVQGMSDNGQYVFFDTSEKLVPQAANQEGEHPELDTYEWHENTETHTDTISLIGAGNVSSPTYFLGYSPYQLPDGTQVEGGNVFIGTHARLSTQDTNNVGNIYDARICEPESPCLQPPPGETAQCEGGTCQTPPTPPVFHTPASSTFSGPANPVSTPTIVKSNPKCKKGYVKKKSKCTRVKRAKKIKRAKRSAGGG